MRYNYSDKKINEKQFHITSRSRHLRYIFFIDENYSYEKLFALICVNQRVWGGRFNPIIPVKNNEILEKHKEALKLYDPDFVFYTPNVELKIITQLLFNPYEYRILDEKLLFDFFAVYTTRYGKGSKIIISTSNLEENENKLFDFYDINFGFERTTHLDKSKIGKDDNTIHIDQSNINSLNEIIYREKPINIVHLSRLNLNTKVLRTGKNHNDQIVIAKDKKSTTDLIYFWNNLRFDNHNILYLTFDELNHLCKDEFFGDILFDAFNYKRLVNVVSTTLAKEQIQELIETKFKPIALCNKSKFGDMQNKFKFEEIEDFDTNYEGWADSFLPEDTYGEAPIKKAISSDSGMIDINELSFVNDTNSNTGTWAIDYQIEDIEKYYKNEYKLPYTTNTRYFFPNCDWGRVNKERRISVIINNEVLKSKTLEITIPPFNKLTKQLITSPILQREEIENSYYNTSLNDDSRKLSAFLKAFENDFLTIKKIFEDKFWVSIFKELATSRKNPGDCISLNNLCTKCKSVLKEDNLIELNKINEIVIKEDDSIFTEKNLQRGIKKVLTQFCKYSIFLKGFKLKCTKCSSNFWYHINDVSETVKCKGCTKGFNFPVEAEQSYKLNDLFKNNMFKSETQPDGNLTVIRTLAHLWNSTSFMFHPQINIFESKNKKPTCDIDIFCISDGLLIIGEAKHNSKGFFDEKNKSLDSLVKVAKTILPDKIILSCSVDKNRKLEKAKRYVLGKFHKCKFQPTIDTLTLQDPNESELDLIDYFHYE